MSGDRLRALLDDYRPGYSLPQAFYASDDIFDADLASVFAREWLFVGNTCEIKTPGDYLTFEIGAASVIVLRGSEGEVRAFHNTCRHRGSRICLKEAGHAKRLVCPYHQWVYELDGRLRNARQMPADFDKSAFGLKPAPVEVICGMIYISLADAPPSLDRYRAAVKPYIAPHRLDRAKVAFTTTTVEQANWKLVIENNRECYHCAANHPELLTTFVEFEPHDHARTPAQKDLLERSTTKWDKLKLPYRLVEGAGFRCTRLPFHDGTVSFTTDGKLACNKLLGDLTEPELGSVRMFCAPNNWNHFLSDHIIHFRVLPLSANQTALRTTWLVHEDAVEGVDYDVERLTEVWRTTNDQDRRLVENNHRGLLSSAYQPGPYAPSEFMLKDFCDWYVGKLNAYAAKPAATAPRKVNTLELVN
ncbi:MAG: aromatic ring-hydroxylating oxygenase subunit alpha [Pseudolabrys sp.]